MKCTIFAFSLVVLDIDLSPDFLISYYTVFTIIYFAFSNYCNHVILLISPLFFSMR